MPYVETITVGLNEVVRGFSEPSIDPVATAQVVAPLLEADKVWSDLVALKDALAANLLAQGQIWKQWELQTTGSAEWIACESQWKTAQAAYLKIQEQCRDQGRLLEERKNQLFAEHGVRFEVRGIHEIDESTRNSLQVKLAELTPGSVILLDGSTVVNNFGLKYWTNIDGTWADTTIGEVGEEVPEGSFTDEQLTGAQLAEIEDQLDLERIADLTPEARAAEKDQCLEEALAESAKKRGEYEILNLEDPLGLAQTWYQEQVATINERYAEPI